MIPMEKRLEFEIINNQAKYEACIFGLEALRSMGAEEITVYGDSILVIRQASKEQEVREDKLRQYWDYLANVLLSFTQCNFIHLPREENQVADALAALAPIWKNGEQANIKSLILVRSRTSYYEEIQVMSVDTIEKP